MAELSFYVKQLGRSMLMDYSNIYEGFVSTNFNLNIFFLDITGRETGSNKQTASKSCALSLVRQLYHLGVIEAFSGTLKKNKEAEQIKPYPVRISPELESQIHDVLSSLDIKPVTVNVCRLLFKYYSVIKLQFLA